MAGECTLSATTVSDNAPNADIVVEAERLLGAAVAADVPVRLVGGLAVRAHLPPGTMPVITREYKDIDLVTLKGRSRAVTAFMTEQGYEADRVFNTTNGHRRLLYYDVPHQRQVDVFVGAFEMCHAIPITERIELHPTAVPLAELLLTKMQIVELNAKDQSDIVTMLYHHEVGSGDDGVINAEPRRQALRRRLGPVADDQDEHRAHPPGAGRRRRRRRGQRRGGAAAGAAVGGDRGRAQVGPLEDAKPRGRQGALVRGARRGGLTRDRCLAPVLGARHLARSTGGSAARCRGRPGPPSSSGRGR